MTRRRIFVKSQDFPDWTNPDHSESHRIESPSRKRESRYGQLHASVLSILYYFELRIRILTPITQGDV